MFSRLHNGFSYGGQRFRNGRSCTDYYFSRSDHYYNCYRPLRRHHVYNDPWYGYSYSSVYHQLPLLYRPVDVDVEIHYVDSPPSTEYGDVVYVDPAPADELGSVAYAGAVASPSHAQPAPLAATGTTVAPAPTQGAVEIGEPTVVERGTVAFAEGRYEEASRLYISATLADERDGYAKLLYSLANFALGDYEIAAMALHRALLTAPDLIEYPVDVRTYYDDPLLFESHLHALSRYTEGRRDDTSARLLLAYWHYATGDPTRALVIAEALATELPDDETVTMLRDGINRVLQEGR